MKIYHLIAKLWASSPQFIRSIYYWASGDKTLAKLLIPDKHEVVEI